MLLDNKNIRGVIDAVTSKAVLILGRFTGERPVLDAMADELLKKGYIPIIFDFERSASRDLIETIKTLTGLCLFVIADITAVRSVAAELQAVVPDYQVPFVPIIKKGEEPYATFWALKTKHNWVLAPVKYTSRDRLLQIFEKEVIARALKQHQKLLAVKNKKSG